MSDKERLIEKVRRLRNEKTVYDAARVEIIFGTDQKISGESEPHMWSTLGTSNDGYWRQYKLLRPEPLWCPCDQGHCYYAGEDPNATHREFLVAIGVEIDP